MGHFFDTQLDDFKKSASKGYGIAKLQHERLKDTIEITQGQIKKTLNEFNKSNYMDSSVTNSLSSQLSEISQSFGDLETKTYNDIKKLKESLSLFSITLFGRTMAGKSTLMEYLTRGNGKSIGQGGQRTTRDVRRYQWNSLSITDVPGIGAFEGMEDETIAFDAAKQGDIILFLLTDDAPQYAEAECLKRIIELGKPVIIILNVKSTILVNDSLKLILRDVTKKFNGDHTENIKRQFYDFAAQFGQQWEHIPIVPVHLQAAYLSQSVQDEEKRQELYKISRIEALQNIIIDSVKEKGNFYRIKNFIDIIDTPMLAAMELLLEQSNNNSTQGRVILRKKRQLEKWKDKFSEESTKKITTFVSSVKSNLHRDVGMFAEEHYNDKNASEAWHQHLMCCEIETKSKELLTEIEDKCNRYLSEISREISSELEFSSHIVADSSLNMERIVDGKRIWNWTTLAIGGGLGIAAAITGLCGAICAGPLGLAALIVAGIGVLFSKVFRDKTKKIANARRALEEKLFENVNSICTKLENTLLSCLKEIEENRIELLCKEMQRILNVIFELSNGQKKLAWSINNRILDVNKEMLQIAFTLTGFDGLQYHVKQVARIPGQAMLLELPSGKRFPDDCKEKIKNLTGEELSFIVEADSKRFFLSKIFGNRINPTNIRIEEKIGVAHIPIDKKNPFLTKRVRLAQQLTELLITK